MNTKQKIIAEIQTLPESMLTEILNQIENLKHQKLEEKEIINQSNDYPLKNSVIYYNDPFEPCIPIEDWDAL
jgi:hypothetical protein